MTTDEVSDGCHQRRRSRAIEVAPPGSQLLGLGAGHTFAEWETRGTPRPSPHDRAGRLEEFVDAVARLLNGDT